MPGHTLPCHPPRTRAGGARSRAASRGPRLSERARLAERQTLGRETESQRHGVARCGAHLVGVRAHHVCRGRAGLGVGIQALEHLGRRRCGRNCTTGYRNEHSVPVTTNRRRFSPWTRATCSPRSSSLRAGMHAPGAPRAARLRVGSCGTESPAACARSTGRRCCLARATMRESVAICARRDATGACPPGSRARRLGSRRWCWPGPVTPVPGGKAAARCASPLGLTRLGLVGPGRTVAVCAFLGWYSRRINQ